VYVSIRPGRPSLVQAPKTWSRTPTRIATSPAENGVTRNKTQKQTSQRVLSGLVILAGTNSGRAESGSCRFLGAAAFVSQCVRLIARECACELFVDFEHPGGARTACPRQTTVWGASPDLRKKSLCSRGRAVRAPFPGGLRCAATPPVGRDYFLSGLRRHTRGQDRDGATPSEPLPWPLRCETVSGLIFDSRLWHTQNCTSQVQWRSAKRLSAPFVRR
jgi:hypothetical protein